MTQIIAEIGVNWDGNFELARKMMTKVKECGCNAVKFQAFNEKNLNNHPQTERLMKSAISGSNIDTINEISKSVGIEWFCTPMYLEAVDMLEPYVKRYKIRELDGRPLLENTTSPLLDKVLKTDNEIIISANKSPRSSPYFKSPKIKWLYCVPKYPCELKDLDFKNLSDFDGLSNHCPKLIAPLKAVLLGSNIIEIHVTNDKSKDYVDNNVSFTFTELKQLIHLIEDSNKIKN